MTNYKHFLYTALCFSCVNAEADTYQDLAAQLAQQDCLAATFEQRLLDVDGQELQASSGIVNAAKPNKLRWDINDPDTQLIISDGETLWRYEADLEQLIVSSFEAQGVGLPSRILSGDIEALNNYIIEKVADTYQLSPKLPSDIFQLLSLRFNATGLAQILMTDSFEQVTDIQLTATDANCNDTSLYQFIAPEGIDIIYE